MSEALKLGVSSKVITPEIGCNLMGYRPTVISDSVNDDLKVTAFIFGQGETLAAMISADVCIVKTEICELIRDRLEGEFGIPRTNCIIHAIHTHSGPNLAGIPGWGDINEEYLNGTFLAGIIGAVSEAVESMKPVKMGYASGMSYIGVNRREITVRNTVLLGQNPWGAFNPEMTVISFKDYEGNTVANMIHYGCHATAAGMNTEISRDWPGVMVDVLAEVSKAPTAFFNGPEGDVGPRMTNGSTTGRQLARYAMEIGGAAAQDAVRIYRDVRAFHDVELAVINDNIELPLEPLMPYEEVKAHYEEFKDETVNLRGKKAKYYKELLELHESGYVSKAKLPIEQTIIRLGDIAFVGFPYELFSEIGMRIAKESNVPHTLSLSLANGSEGYFVTEDQICRGGYEVDSFKTAYIQPYANNADWHMVTETLKNLKKFDEKENN